MEHGHDPLDYKGKTSASERPEAEVGSGDTSVYPGSQGGGNAHGHKGHKMGGTRSHEEHPSPKSMGHHGKKGKY